MNTIHLARLLTAAVVMAAVPVWAQSDPRVDAVVQRLEQLERQNAELREQLGQLRQELDRVKQVAPEGAPLTAARVDALEEKVDLHDGRLSEQEQVKVEGSQRAPLRITGMFLFNAYANGRHGGANDDPVVALVNRGVVNSGGSVRGTIFGVSFNSPRAVLGGQIQGTVLLDLQGDEQNLGPVVAIHPRFRIASVEGIWNKRSILVGQDKIIFAPREPTSLAIRPFVAMVGAGNLYGWRPQIRFEQRIGVGASNEFHARIGVVETFEDWPRAQTEVASSVQLRRPGLEGHFQFGHRIDEARRAEIGFGFHRSTTYVGSTGIPSEILSVDGFANPLPWLELTGTAFTGQNLAHFSGRSFFGFTYLTPSPGTSLVIPVRQRGGWGQATFLATRRLSVNLLGGMEQPNSDDVIAGAIVKNTAYIANAYYRIAPNVLGGFEISQVQTFYKAGPHPLNVHYDLHLAYFF